MEEQLEEEKRVADALALEKFWASRGLGGKSVGMNGNGGKTFWGGALDSGFVLKVLTILLIASGAWFVTRYQVDANCDAITRIRTDLKNDYMPREVIETRLTDIDEKLGEQGADIKAIMRDLGVAGGQRSSSPD